MIKKLFPLIGAASLALSSLFITPGTADAASWSKRYTWFKYVGRTYIYDGWLSRSPVGFNDDQLTMQVKFKLPRCPSGYRLSGGVYARFNSFQGNTTGWKTMFYTSGSTYYEGKILTRYKNHAQAMNSGGGDFRVKSTIACVSY